MASIICGNCARIHSAVAVVKACHEGRVYPCHWGVQRSTEDGLVVMDCGADAVVTERGFSCDAGHEHVNMETRHSEGWDHVESWDEALALAMAGVEPRTMSGHLVTHPSNFYAA